MYAFKRMPLGFWIHGMRKCLPHATSRQTPSALSFPLLDSVLPSPLSRGRFVPRTVGLVNVCDLWHQRIVGVRICEHRTDGEKHCMLHISDHSNSNVVVLV